MKNAKNVNIRFKLECERDYVTAGFPRKLKTKTVDFAKFVRFLKKNEHNSDIGNPYLFVGQLLIEGPMRFRVKTDGHVDCYDVEMC